MGLEPGARFSKVPYNAGPDNLSGPLSGNFIGPEIVFLQALSWYLPGPII